MTSQPHPRLHAVPAETIGTTGPGATVAARWAPQHQFVGALLWHPAATVRPLLNVVPVGVIDDPLTRWTYELVAALIAEDRDPHPTAVLHRAKTQPAAQALRPDRAPSQRQHHRLATHLAGLYTQVLCPAAVVDHARDVLDDAHRHTVATVGARIQHLAETCTTSAELDAQVADALADLHAAQSAAPTSST